MKNIYANTVLTNGKIYTADKNDTIAEAVAIKDGCILAVGSNEAINKYVDKYTSQVDLQGNFVMPGIIDSHMHPFWGAKQLVETSLDYQSLDVKGILSELQKVLDKEQKSIDNKWLVVRAWLCVGGTFIDKNDLDKLNTSRPVVLFSNDCHYLALNTKGLEILSLKNGAPLPDNGVIVLDHHGKPVGLLEDGTAMEYFDKITYADVELGIKIFSKAQYQLNKQGITTLMDARAINEEFEIFKAMQDQNKLTIRILGAFEVKSRHLKTEENFQQWLASYKLFKQNYSTENWQADKVSLSVHQAKFFIDGMIPSKTAYMLQPYFENKGTDKNINLVKTDFYGNPYFTQNQLEYAFKVCADNDIDPHMHTIADGAIEICLNAIEKMRKHIGNKDIRPALAHVDITSSSQYQRFKELRVTANLSFQWAGYTQEIIDLHEKLVGPERIKTNFETHGKFFDAGVNVAYNSDWPIDPLNEWYNFQVGLTRRIDDTHPRLSSDRNLKPQEVLRAATINAAYALKKEQFIGSLEKGKFADLIVLDNDPFTIDSNKFATIKVINTVIGGKEVYRLS